MEDTAYTLYQDGPGGRELTLEVRPVVGSITSITDDNTRNFTSSAYVVASGDYFLVDGDKGLVRLLTSSTHGEWSKVRGSIKAVYTAGWVTIPPKLKRLCAQLVRHLWDHRTSQGKVSVAGQNRSAVTYADPGEMIPPEVAEGLVQYHLPRRYA